MNATAAATQTARQHLEQQIASIRQEAEQAKANPELFEQAFLLYDKAEQLQALLDDAIEIYKM
jgi:hypothetical protein